MKKRIAASALAVVLMVNIVGDHTRARAEPATLTAIAAIGILAFNLLGIMSGRYDDTAEAIGVFLENGVEGWEAAFVGSDDTPSWFATGWSQIYSTCTSWFESGEITLDDNGLIKMDYEQYLALCDQMLDYVDYDIYLGMDINYSLLSCAEGFKVVVQSLDYNIAEGCSYIPCYYSADHIYFSGDYIYTQFYNATGSKLTINFNAYNANGSYVARGINGGATLGDDGDAKWFSTYKPFFSYLDNTIYISASTTAVRIFTPTHLLLINGTLSTPQQAIIFLSVHMKMLIQI